MLNLVRVSFNLLTALDRLRWNREKLRRYQDKHLRSIVTYTYNNVLFYRRLFKDVKISPSDIQTVDDLCKIPITRKSDMKRQPAANLVSKEFAVSTLKVIRTGGSTGEPFSVYISPSEDDWRKAIYMRANVCCGQKPRDRWIAILDAERAADTSTFQHYVGIFAKKIVPVVWSRKTQLEAVQNFNPDILDGFSSALWLLAKEAQLTGTNGIHPRIVFGSGELISQSLKEYLEKCFGAPYYDQFGCTEIDRSAWQCSERHGYHMDVDSVIMEFVDKNGEEVGCGERGEIVYTSLFNCAMPIIRYGVRDIGVPIDDMCPCGNKLPLMKVVEGRSNSFLVFPHGHIISPMSFIETLKAFCYVNEIDQYRVLQKKEDLIEIWVKKTNENVDEGLLEERLIKNIHEGLPKVENVDLSEVQFKVKFVQELPKIGGGKLNVVISDVQLSDQNQQQSFGPT
jgi:phenylacetate-CoA ligase